MSASPASAPSIAETTAQRRPRPPSFTTTDGWLLGTALLVRVYMAHRLELFPDEAYYWTWSQTLDWGYFDHPPAIAWLIAATTRVFGNSPLAVRAPSLLMGMLLALLVHNAARRLWEGHHHPSLAMGIALWMPMGMAGGFLATPDAPLCFGWMLAITGLLRWKKPAQPSTPTAPKSAPSLPWTEISLIVVGTGLACLSKYTGLLLLPILMGWARVVFTQNPQTWRPLALIGILLALLLAPHMGWLQQHDWVTLRWQLDHGLTRARGGGLAGLAAFAGGQLGVVTPVVLLGCVGFWLAPVARRCGCSRSGWCSTFVGTACSGKAKRNGGSSRSGWRSRFLRKTKAAAVEDRGTPHISPPLRSLLWWSSAPVFVLFLAASLSTRGEANWAAPAYFAALLATPWHLWARGVRRTLQISLPAITLLTIAQLISNPPLLPLGPSDPTGQGYGWSALAEAARNTLTPNTQVIVTDRYQEAAAIQFALGGHVPVVALQGRGRPDQYDLWPAPTLETGQELLWINRAGRGSAPPFTGYQPLEAPLEVTVGRAGQLRKYHLHRMAKTATAPDPLAMPRAR